MAALLACPVNKETTDFTKNTQTHLFKNVHYIPSSGLITLHVEIIIKIRFKLK